MLGDGASGKWAPPIDHFTLGMVQDLIFPHMRMKYSAVRNSLNGEAAGPFTLHNWHGECDGEKMSKITRLTFTTITITASPVGIQPWTLRFFVLPSPLPQGPELTTEALAAAPPAGARAS